MHDDSHAHLQYRNGKSIFKLFDDSLRRMNCNPGVAREQHFAYGFKAWFLKRTGPAKQKEQGDSKKHKTCA